ncbi:OLC1v1006903C1 [Oldenlandia corymbosa var. corymbosa]|uniref:OLC1v1006903C1 n=1 Tax=Oldenlandia corymbosa var. corymbosa TaxID=529605 RepID=A0AAV1DI41_OLDCO|nr:OLC1v1006903C1 [Oldenlandia corymbosa var. corymbosa]
MESIDDDSDGEWPTSPMQVLEDAVRAAGEALHNVYSRSLPPSSPESFGHRRTRSDVVGNPLHKRSNSIQRFKSHMQRALRWGGNSSEHSRSTSFNPEILADQKRQWYECHSKTLDYSRYKEPTSLFEHFVIVGLHPDANLEVFEEAFARRRKWELDMAKSDHFDFRTLENQGPSLPKLEPQILFGYPPGKKLAMRPKDLASFCFPSGVKARVVQKTPSLSDLNEVVYGQEHLIRDDLSFIFSLKVADNATLYGVCLLVQEFVQRAPAICRVSSSVSQSSLGLSRYLVSAPRCYCVLTRVPFFELHYEMLNSIIMQGRLNRINYCISELAVTDHSLSTSKSCNESENTDSLPWVAEGEWKASDVPIDSAIALASVDGLDHEVTSLSSRWESLSPGRDTSSEVSDHIQMRTLHQDCGNDMHHLNNASCELSENHSVMEEKIHEDYESEPASHVVDSCACLENENLERLESFESFSSATSMVVLEDNDDIFLDNGTYVGNDMTLEWAKENKNDLLQIVGNYYSISLPPRGSEIIFQPLEHLQAIHYTRLPLSALQSSGEQSDPEIQDPNKASQVILQFAVAEEAAALSLWTTVTLCRMLSLEKILALITGVLLEKQVIMLCPNLGVLSAMVLSIIPIIRPFEWQSLFLPILPEKMLDFLDAPVPFIVGIQHKLANLKMKSSNIVIVNVVKDQVKMSNLPVLPRYKELISKLEPYHARLSSRSSNAQKHPIYRCNEVQAEAATHFLHVMKHYFESLCSDLRSYSITYVQSNNDRVSVLLKDSFIESFERKDQPFIKTPDCEYVGSNKLYHSSSRCKK